jgi:hypothetical protein
MGNTNPLAAAAVVRPSLTLQDAGCPIATTTRHYGPLIYEGNVKWCRKNQSGGEYNLSVSG